MRSVQNLIEFLLHENGKKTNKSLYFIANVSSSVAGILMNPKSNIFFVYLKIEHITNKMIM